jgi:hypothetical protein
MCSKTGIVLFVYNRPHHTKEVLKGLKNNNISQLYIFSDGSKNERDTEEVKEVRSLIRDIDWCDTEIHLSFQNKGLANSITDGVNYMLSKYDRVIVLEDDCLPSPDFVSFMEACFDRYENTEKIMSISGYSLPIRIPKNYKYDIYFSYRPSSWGWGTWRRAWNFFEMDETFLKEFKESRNIRKKIARAGDVLISLSEAQLKGEIDSWAVFWSLNIIKREGLCIYSVKPRVKNIGFDGSGVHCHPQTRYETGLIKHCDRNYIFPDANELNGKILREFKRFYTIPYGIKVRTKIKNLLKFLHLFFLLKKIKLKINKARLKQ